MVNIIDGSTSLTHRIVRALNVGADRDILHDLIVVEEQKASEEEFFFAFHAAQMIFSDLEAASPSTGR